MAMMVCMKLYSRYWGTNMNSPYEILVDGVMLMRARTLADAEYFALGFPARRVDIYQAIQTVEVRHIKRMG